LAVVAATAALPTARRRLRSRPRLEQCRAVVSTILSLIARARWKPVQRQDARAGVLLPSREDQAARSQITCSRPEHPGRRTNGMALAMIVDRFRSGAVPHEALVAAVAGAAVAAPLAWLP